MTEFQLKVQAVKERFPKHTPTALSLAQRSTETGVCLVPEAQKIVDAVESATRPYKRHSPRRVKTVRFMCRLTPAAAEIVKHEMERAGVCSVQTLLENLLIEWAKKSRSPVYQTEERRGVGAIAESVSAPENNTNS